MPGLNYLNDIEYHRRITRDDLVHHLLGNGLIQAVVQVTENLAARNALVLHLMSPERFEGRHKSESFTFHRQLGPELTLVGVRHGGEVYVANPRQAACDLRYRLDFSGGEPVFRASYPLDFTLEGRRAKTPFTVEEMIFCPPERPVLARRVRVTNRRGLDPAEATLVACLIPNQSLFPEAHFLTGAGVAVAGQFERGDEFVGLATVEAATGHAVGEFPGPFEALASGLGQAVSRDDAEFVRPKQGYSNYPLLPESPHVGAVLALEIDLGRLAPGAAREATVLYAYGASEAEVTRAVTGARGAAGEGLRAEARQFWQGFNTLQTGHGGLNALFSAAQAGLRASVAASGRMNAGIWGYNAEWVRDSSLACTGAILSGQFEMAAAMLDHMLRDMVNDEGLAFGESQFYELERAELDQNGELLYALWLYWTHSGDEAPVRRHWDRVRALAEFPLRSEFWVEAAGMVRSVRDVHERDLERHGLLPGFELSHQVWVSEGLRCAADLAALMGDARMARRWADLSGQMRTAVLDHPDFRLQENDYFMKRRLLDGPFQRAAQARPYVHRPTEAPLTRMYPRCLNRSGALEPDAFEVWPIAFEWVDPAGRLAQRTLIRMEQLWNQEWDRGGYPLQNVESEPTKLGSWPLTLWIITQAALQAGNDDTVRRNLDWWLGAKDGRGFMWWEYRDADPAWQIDHGVIPWLIYGEALNFLVHHLLGYRPRPDGVRFQPRVPVGFGPLSARLRHGAHWIEVRVQGAGSRIARATLNGTPCADVEAMAVNLGRLETDAHVDIWLED